MSEGMAQFKIEDTEWVDAASTNAAENPFIEALRVSKATNTPKQVTVATGEAKSVVGLLRAAVKVSPGVGIKIRVVVGGEEFVPTTELWDQLAKSGHKTVTVKFRGKEATIRARKNVPTVAEEKKSGGK